MTIEQTWRLRQRRELRAELPKIIGGAFAAMLFGAGAFGIALWVTNPPPEVMRYGDAVDPSPAGALLAQVDIHPHQG